MTGSKRVGFKLSQVDPVILMRHARRLADQEPGLEADIYLAALNPSGTTYFVDGATDRELACVRPTPSGTLVRNTRSPQNG